MVVKQFFLDSESGQKQSVKLLQNTNTNNLFPPFPSDTIMFIYDNYDNKYDNTMSCSCLLSFL